MRRIGIVLAVFLSIAHVAHAAPRFHPTVSGLSSGAFMAAQLHVAHSKTIKGAAILAGGPYGCSQGQVSMALFQCMATYMGPPDGADLFAKAIRMAGDGQIDPVNHIHDSRVVLVTGENDTVVRPSVVYENQAFYSILPKDSLKVIDDLPIGHAFPTLQFGEPCETMNKKPWIVQCGRDIAGEILSHFYGDLKPRVSLNEDSFFEFKQPPGLALDDFGVAYVPEKCRQLDCPVHMSLHGCEQGVTGGIGELFYKNVGFNEWAQANDLIVIYPQAISTLGNPNQCWDWWGYLSSDYLSQKAPQIQALKEILDSFLLGQAQLAPIEKSKIQQ